MESVLLEIRNLSKRYPLRGSSSALLAPKHFQQAVSDLSLSIHDGEVYGLVGESGCGKTTTGRAVLGLVRPDSGEILFRGTDLAALSEKERRPFCREIQLVFQDPLSSMNPRQRIGDLLEEPLRIQHALSAQDRRNRVLDILARTGLSQEHFFRYPHELSGGQVQRLGIARALIIDPKLVICDEPVSALDVSIQAQILNMLRNLQQEMGMSMLFISHDIGVVRYISQRIGVMYLGSLVEEAPAEELFAHPAHPYTQALFASVPDLHRDSVVHPVIQGESTLRDETFRGCVFAARCPHAEARCREEAPSMRELEPGHRAACHLL